MRTIEQINADLMSLWCETFTDGSNTYAPVPYMTPEPGAIVFVGMNPSFSFRGWKTILRYAARPDVDPSSLFKWPSSEDFDEHLVQKLEAVARDHYPFFAPHKELSAAMGLPWAHFDLFAYRETTQIKAKSLVVANESEVRLTSFGESQFRLFEEALALAQPSAVVVVNALASQIYRARRSLDFDSVLGFYRDRTFTGHVTPVFFSGMLTGMRALDRFSKDRLFWHIANALNKSWHPVASQETHPK